MEGLSVVVVRGFKTFTTPNIPTQIKPGDRGEREEGEGEEKRKKERESERLVL